MPVLERVQMAWREGFSWLISGAVAGKGNDDRIEGLDVGRARP
jgi:hypothetical protein